MTRKSPREIERELERFQGDDDSEDAGGAVIGFEDPETGGLLDEDGDPIEDPSGVIFRIRHDIWREWDGENYESLPYPGTDDPGNSGEDTADPHSGR